MEPFDQVCALLPPHLRRSAETLPALVTRRVEEIHLRCGKRGALTVKGDELPLPWPEPITRRDLELVIEIATQASAHAALERVRQGYFTVRGGHRVGLCGSVVTEEGRVKNLRCLSSLNLRVAHDLPGCGEEAVKALTERGEFPSTLLLAPPGGGKTTLLRDMVRLLSNGFCARPLRVGLCDERGEVAALWEGAPQFDVGERTDVLEGCPKAQALMMLLRGMDPQVLACDEITESADCAALGQCAGCGVKLLATVHAKAVDDLMGKEVYRELLGRGIFEKAVVLSPDHSFRVEKLPC